MRRILLALLAVVLVAMVCGCDQPAETIPEDSPDFPAGTDYTCVVTNDDGSEQTGFVDQYGVVHFV